MYLLNLWGDSSSGRCLCSLRPRLLISRWSVLEQKFKSLLVSVPNQNWGFHLKFQSIRCKREMFIKHNEDLVDILLSFLWWLFSRNWPDYLLIRLSVLFRLSRRSGRCSQFSWPTVSFKLYKACPDSPPV